MTTKGSGRSGAGFATRLMLIQTLVLVAGATTSWIVATAVGPGIFADHFSQAGVSTTAREAAHIAGAFDSSLVLSLGVALLVSMAIALAVTWFFTRRVQRSIDAVADSAARIATGDYASRVASPGLGTEFELLTGTINELAERLEGVERTRRRMLSDLAHEMRTPIATIEAHLEAIEDQVRTPDAETLGVIKASADRLERLAGDISAISKAEEGQLEVNFEPLDAGDLVVAAVTAARPTAAAKQVTLADQIDHIPVPVRADRARVGQVLANLLDNAIRHSRPGDTVTVSCRLVERSWVEFAVKDHGAGIAPEHIGHVFDRFYRADTARNRSQGGSGIGLTITRALVEAHGGRIWAASSGPGLGATFTVRLPAARSPSARTETRRSG